MSDIKPVIGLLCKHLNFLLNLHLKPEFFRLAKFNKTDDNIVKTFWNMLNALTVKTDTNKVQLVKNYLKSMEYPNKAFFFLPEDMSEGSRELLIALGFLLCHTLPKLVKEELKNSPFNPDFQTSEHANTSPSKPVENSNYLMWVEGKIRLNLRLAKEYQQQNRKLLEKLKPSRFTIELNTNEILALNSKKHCSIFLEDSERVLQVLENHQNWTRKENVFWKWMETVLAEKAKETTGIND